MDNQLVLTFLKTLARNNNREWFEKNKSKYLAAKECFEEFIRAALPVLAKEDASLTGLDPKKLAFRIYRDVRFSKDKSPYKTNMGATFSAGGKLMQAPGYYLHFEPGNKSMFAGGLYMPDPANLAAIRQEIDYNGDKLKKIIAAKAFKTNFGDFDDSDKLKTVPKGYAKEHPYIEWLKLKSFIVVYTFTDKEVTDKNLIKKIAALVKATKPLNDFLQEAVAK